MNCRRARDLIHAERDRDLAIAERAALDSHLPDCPGCREERALLERAALAWKETRAATAVPDSTREWQSVRRRLREVEEPPARRLGWIGALAVGAAAAAVAAFVFLPTGEHGRASSAPVLAQAESVEFTDDDATPVVFVDDQSGWLVVWAVSPDQTRS
ncbi:hypothetical protein ASA1KI_28810 [Opitutales bacterium ASA1]|uniref:anti-sigma factor family protein n=1 Tax=Congregicoccus parvus TaxID=3081749 RepID=UPI002B2D1905|nr:hypothetical protein ASA1KI_28810 [Opitutales bacterium ASA1]